MSIPADETWRLQAACRPGVCPDGADFAFSGTVPDRGAQVALATCHECPVRRACLEYARRFETEVGSCWGVWGGMTAGDRRHRWGLPRLHTGGILPDERSCSHCGQTFKPHSPLHVCCSDPCRIARKNARRTQP